jgi:aspartate-semialdehyde dehydrogenase
MLRRKERYTVAVIGATGIVGKESLEILEERKFPLEELRLFASERSAGQRLSCQGRDWTVKVLTPDTSFKGIDLAFISATEQVSREYAPRLASAGAIVIDDSAAFRMEKDVPLVVPEVNGTALASFPRGIVAIPNCTTTPLVMVLKPLREAVGIKRAVVTTFQSVSGTGAAAIDELMEQTRALLSFQEIETRVYPHQIAFNCLPFVGSFSEPGDCSEENKIIQETRKILDAPDLRVAATTVRAPIFRCHSESVNVETERRISANEARAVLSAAPGVLVYDDPGRKLYPMPVEVAGADPVYVGRVREDHSLPAGLSLWIVSDNLRKGAALNAVQIAEELIQAA